MIGNLLSRAFSPQAILGFGFLVLVITCILPFGTLIYKAFFSGIDGGFTFENVEKVFSGPSTIKAIKNTVIVSSLTAFLSLILAVPLGWILSRTDIPFSKTLRTLFCFPYAIQPYIGAIAWIYLANPTNGLLNVFLGDSVFNIYSYTGLIWVMSSFFYTFILLVVLASLDRMDSSLEEAARLSGAGPGRIFFQITLPLIAPALLSGMLLVALAAAASFGVPAMIGNPSRIFMMTTKIYLFQKMGSISGIYQAGTLSIVLLVIAAATLYMNQWIQKKWSFQSVSGKSSRPTLVELGHSKKPLLFGLLILLFILFGLPLLGMMISALSKVQGRISFDNLGFQNFYRVLFEVDETLRALGNSTYLAVTAATAATVLGMLLSYIQYKTRIKGRNLLDVIASLPYSTPGTVVALAFIMTFGGKFLGIFPSIYNTLGILFLAYMTKYLSFAIRTTGDGFSQIDESLAEAARVCGASFFQTLKTIWFPLMKPSLVAAWFLIFMPCFSELTMTILLTGPGIETLGTVLFQLQEYGDASGGGAAVLALIIVAVVTAANFIVKSASKGKYGL